MDGNGHGWHARPEAGARHERTLSDVGCSALILIDASSSAYHRGTAGVGQTTSRRGGDLRRFYTQQHQFYVGIDLHARTMSLGILNQAGEILVHRHMPAAPEPFLKTITPYREDVVCVEWTLHLGPGWLVSVLKRGFPWCWVMPSPFWCSTVGSAPSYGNHVRARTPSADYAKPRQAGKKNKTAHRGGLSLDTTGVLISVRRDVCSDLSEKPLRILLTVET